MSKAVHMYHGNMIGANIGADIQVLTMPVASADNLGQIVQFIGTTGTYTNGYFYKCVYDGEIYSWAQVSVQPQPTLGTAAVKDSTNAVTSGSTDLVESGAVKTAIDTAVSSLYKPAGDKTSAELIAALLIADNLGKVYNITTSGTTTADFVGGAGVTINVGDNVAIVDVGTAQNPSYKFDLLSGFIDLSNYIQKSNTVGFIKNDGTVDQTNYQAAGVIPVNPASTEGLNIWIET